MIRAWVFLGGFLLASAGSPDIEGQADCVLDGGEAASELMDASIYIWAAVERCGKAGDDHLCQIDVSAAVHSVSDMIAVILKAVGKCGEIDHVNHKCGIAATKLTAAVAGISEGSGCIMQYCDHHEPPPTAGPPPPTTGPPPPPPPGPESPCTTHPPARKLSHYQANPGLHHNWHNQAMCVVDLKDTMKSLMKSIKALLAVKKKCKKGTNECVRNALKIIAAFAGVGEYLTGAIAHCSHNQDVHLANCGYCYTKLIHQLVKVSKQGIAIKEDCGRRRRSRRRESDSRRRESDGRRRQIANVVGSKHKCKPIAAGTVVVPISYPAGSAGTTGDASSMSDCPEGEYPVRLYEGKDITEQDWNPNEEDNYDAVDDNGSKKVALAALLPIIAIVSFVGGRLFGNRPRAARETTILNAMEIE